ncbi:MAG: IclR family transcriptional regulator [Anaerolineales bacterium]|nr:IclR family transcriptional regulator [Anaerolineales bacterium]
MAATRANHEANLIHTVLKAIDVLECLTVADRPLSAPEVGRRCKMSRPTAYRLLVTLAHRGYVNGTEDGCYRLGTRVLSLGHSLLNSLDLLELSKPILHELSQTSHETAHLALLDGAEILYVDKVESSQSVRLHSTIGARNLLHCTAMGKALLAFLPQEEQARLLERMSFPQRTDHTITHRTDLIKHLEAIRVQGFAIDDVENEEGVRCVGAPIFDYTGRAFAALSISGPAYRLSVPRLLELAPLTMKAARAVSAKLGYVPTAEAGYPFKSGC